MSLPLGLDRMATDRRWLLLGLTLAILPHLGRLPVWMSALCALALGWRIAHELGRAPLPGRLLRLALTLGAVGGVFADYHSIVGRDAGVTLLVGLLCLKTLEMRSRRETTFVVLLSFFVVITGFLFGQSLLIGLYMFIVVWALLVALIAAEYGAQARDWQHARRAGVLLGQALPLLAILFVLFPRVDNPLWGVPKDGAAGRTGLSERMAPGEISLLADSPDVAFRVQFDGPLPPPGQRYWRGPVLGAYDGRMWSPLERDGERPPPPAALDTARETAAYTVTLEPHQRRWLFALEWAATLPGHATLTDEYQLLSDAPVSAVTRYRVESRLGARTGPVPEPLLAAYRRLPAGTAPQARAFAERLRGQSASGEEFIRRTLEYFAEEEFYYTREPPLLPGDPVDDFLFDDRRGYCEHYAASFVVMMRAAGLPARVVTGYLGGEVNPLGDYLIVRQSDAHAWAEVWLPAQGWVRVDPTAAIPPARILDTATSSRRLPDEQRLAAAQGSGMGQQLLRQLRYGWDRINHGWNQWIVGYDTARQKGLLERLGLEGVSWPGLAALLFGGVGLVLAGTGLVVARRHRPPVDPAQRCYLRLCNRLERVGLVRAAAEGPTAFAERVARVRPDLAAPVWRATRLYVRERYGPEPDGERARAICRAAARLKRRRLRGSRAADRPPPPASAPR